MTDREVETASSEKAGDAVQPSRLRKYAKRAGVLGLIWLTLELAAGAATVAFGASWLGR